MTRWSISLSEASTSSRTAATFSPASAAATRHLQWCIKAIRHSLSYSALRAAAILATLGGQPIHEQIRDGVGNKLRKVMRHVRKVEAESHDWKQRYKSETGSLRGRIDALVELAHHLRHCRWCCETDVMDCLRGGKELWEAAQMPRVPQEPSQS